MTNLQALTHYHNIFSTMRDVHNMHAAMSREDAQTRLDSIESSIIELEKENLWFGLKNLKEIIKYFGSNVHGYCSIFNYKDTTEGFDGAEKEVDAIREDSHFFYLPLNINIMEGASTNLHFSLDLLDVFIKHGFDINQVFLDSLGEEETVLYDALLVGTLDYAKGLVKRGANINQELMFRCGRMSVADNIIMELNKPNLSTVIEEIAVIEYSKSLAKSLKEKKLLVENIETRTGEAVNAVNKL